MDQSQEPRREAIPIGISETGTLTVQVLTAGGALPLTGAEVIISDAGGGNITEQIVLKSGVAGLTERQTLPAPSREMSQAPTVQPPYSTYDVSVTFPGYYPFLARSVPIFSGINSLQTVQMIPFAPYETRESYPRGEILVPEKENSSLLLPPTATETQE